MTIFGQLLALTLFYYYFFKQALTLPPFFVLLSVQAKIYFPSADKVRKEGFEILLNALTFDKFPLMVSN